MGTSSSYKGSSSKASSKLRDGVDQWEQEQTDAVRTSIPQKVIAQVFNIPIFSRRSSGGGSGGEVGADSGSSPRVGQKQSAPRRDARAYATTAGRAANLARAFREGDRETLARAGLDFDLLSSLPTRAEMVRAILDVVCEAQTSSDIPTEEQRDIAGRLLDWMLDVEQNETLPDAAATAEHAIGIIIAEIFLSETGEFRSSDAITREEFVDAVYETSQQLASRAQTSLRNASQDSIDSAIESGLKFLRRVYKNGAD